MSFSHVIAVVPSELVPELVPPFTQPWCQLNWINPDWCLLPRLRCACVYAVFFCRSFQVELRKVSGLLFILLSLLADSSASSINILGVAAVTCLKFV